MQLIDTLAALEKPDTALDAKIQLTSRTSELMPQGKPQYLLMRSYPMIASLIAEHGRGNVTKAIFLLIKDFCASLNVVRNMNDTQMIEAAGMLIDECGNFRLEDYVMMFSLAKRGQLVKVFDRVDIQVIGDMLDAYWQMRNAAGEREQAKAPELSIPKDAKLVDPALVAEAVKKLQEDARIAQEERDKANEQGMEQRRAEILRRYRMLNEGKDPDQIEEAA